MIVYYASLLNVGLSCLDMVGLNFLKDSVLTSKSVLSLISPIALGLLAVWGLLVNQVSFKYCLDVSLTLLAVTSSLSKFANMIVKKKQFRNLVEDVNKFWPIEGQSQAFEEKTKRYLYNWNVAQRFFKIYLLVSVVSCYTVVFVTDAMVFTCHCPEILLRKICQILNALSINVILYTFVGYDLFFCGVLILLVVQFRILNNRLKSFDYSLNSNDERNHHIRTCIIHHNFLLSLVFDINKIFGSTIFIQFQIVLAAMSLCLLGLLQTDYNMGRKIMLMIFMSLGLADLFIFYCFPGELLQGEIYDTVNSIYQSNFYECVDISTKKSLLLMMIRSNKDVNIIGGKIMIMNLRTYTAICKTIYSFFMALQNIINAK